MKYISDNLTNTVLKHVFKHVALQDLKQVLDLMNFAFLHLVYSHFLRKGPRRAFILQR